MLPSGIRFSSSRVAVALAGIGITALIVITPFLVAIIVAATSGIPASVCETATVAISATKPGGNRR
jgi:amino acid permease